MKIAVLKFGGSSLCDAERIMNAAAIVKRHISDGCGAVVVVSAQGDSTDELLERLSRINPDCPARERDMLLSSGERVSAALMAAALEKIGVPSISLSGRQAGIFTNDRHGEATITSIDTARILKELSRDKVVVVAGFQGDCGGETTTLGRGGSDTSAVALATALCAFRCVIYTDVAGIFTADPREVKEARRIETASSLAVLEAASLGFRVIHGRAASLAHSKNIRVEIASSMGERGTTVIENIEAPSVFGIAVDRDAALVSRRLTANALIEAARLSADMICIKNSLTFCVPKAAAKRLPRCHKCDYDAAKLSVIGGGVRGDRSVMARAVDALTRNGIRIKSVAASELRLSFIVRERDAARGAQLLHKAFFI